MRVLDRGQSGRFAARMAALEPLEIELAKGQRRRIGAHGLLLSRARHFRRIGAFEDRLVLARDAAVGEAKERV